MKTKKVVPFSNATEADWWKSANCYKCKLYEFESTEPEESGCELAFYIDMGYLDEGVPLWVCDKIGITRMDGNTVDLVSKCRQKPKYKPDIIQRKRYNLHRRAKLAGFTGLNARKRTFFTSEPVTELPEAVKILMNQYGYVIQTEIA